MRSTLDNGLTVITEPLHAAPVVAIQAWVKIGSADEAPDEAGLAHLHEHMLFKGTARRGTGEIARAVEARGGEINAWTSFDQTVYHLVLASGFLGDGLDILADALRCSAFDPAELAREIEVVVEEIKRSKDLPSRRVSRELFEAAYRAHPYRLQVLGTEASVRSFTREKILSFFHRHYAPENVVLVVTGDLDPAAAALEIARTFGGDWGRRAGPRFPRAPEPAQAGLRVALAKDAVKEAHLAAAFHVPGVSHDDVPALDVLAVALAQGEGARLNLALRIERPVANDVYASAYTPQDPGLLVAGASLAPDKLPDAVDALVAELVGIGREPLAPEELAVAKALVEADAVYGRETVQGVARKLGFYETVTGDLAFEERYYARVASLQAEEVLAAARRYLTPDNLAFAALVPDELTLVEADLRARILAAAERGPARRTRPQLHPPPASAPFARRPAPKDGGSGVLIEKLASGATVVVKPERAVPLVALRAVYPGGLRLETEADNGVTQLYGRVMTRSTRGRDAEAIAREIDLLAGSLQGSAGRNSLSLRAEMLSKHFERGFALFAECLNEPGFADREIDRERAILLQDIAARDDNPSGAAFDLFLRTLFAVHPYRFDVLGEKASVAALARPQLAQLHARALNPSNLTLCVVGDVEPDLVFARAEALFGASERPRVPAPPVPREPPQDRSRRAFRELDKAQAHVVYGFTGLELSSPDRFALEVLSSVLSGQGGRLFAQLRDREALAYSVSSFSVEGIDPGYFGVYIGTSPEKVGQALQGILRELDRVVREPIRGEELDRARRYLVGAHAIGLQRNGARAAVMAFDESYGIGAEEYQRYPSRIEAVTPERVLEVARRIVDPRRAALAILGPREANVELVS